MLNVQLVTGMDALRQTNEEHINALTQSCAEQYQDTTKLLQETITLLKECVLVSDS